MGTCYNCGTEVTLKEEETRCDSCKEILRYWCNNCAKPFDIESKEKRLSECRFCGYFICPNCKSCGEKCFKHELRIKINIILSLDSSIENKTENIIDLLENTETSPMRCCEKGVPITYAKNRIKSCFAKQVGFRSKSPEDTKKFQERLLEIKNKQEGEEITISKVRENGSYGQEYRDVMNYCVCLGIVKVVSIKTEEGITKTKWIRTSVKDILLCRFLDMKDLVVKRCKKCKKSYPRDYQGNCCFYKKTEKKGEPYPLIESLSNKDTCQLERKSFVVRRDDDRRDNTGS